MQYSVDTYKYYLKYIYVINMYNEPLISTQYIAHI